MRGSLVALQQLAITFGIMVSFWIDFGTNYIGGTGATQSEAAWRIALALQLVPAIILGIGILFMPFSPRYGSFGLLRKSHGGNRRTYLDGL